MEQLIKGYEDTLLKTQELLQENNEWVERYAFYAKYIEDNIQKVQELSEKFHMPSELRTYMPISNFKKTTKNKAYFDVRFMGVSVATLCVDISGDKELFLKQNCLKKLPDYEQQNFCKMEKILWKSKEGTSFRKYFKDLSMNAIALGFSEEHQVESMLLKDFSKKSSKTKYFRNIQPVMLAKQRFPMPTSIKAHLAKDGKLAFAGHFGGGIDIFTRFGNGKGTYLSVIELKDQSDIKEPPEKAIKQAISYATFIRELLRNEKTNAETWWKIFGFKEGTLPEKLKINAVIAMPKDEKNRIDFGEKRLSFSNPPGADMIELHYWYFDKDLQGEAMTSLKLC